MKNHIPLDELDIYTLAMEIGESVWKQTSRWNWFEQKTLGSQYVCAADSIAANIAEGYGRFFYKDRKQFYYYSRGSLLETKTWATKAFQRELMHPEEFATIFEKLQTLHHKLNIAIQKLKQLPPD